ncbi:MAG: GerAB/ArcD/ProY family transporter [Clostridia bacterium]|nr:GerAB/ArcD/ProY family transporter [Clostridia bacterium]
MNDRMTSRQQLLLMTTCLFSPMVRLLPRLNTAKAGQGAWISILIAAVPTLLMVIFAHFFIQGKDGKGTLGDMFTRAYGKVAGNVINMLLTIWIAVYSGVVLRTSSERMISTIYKQAEPMFFSLVLILLILMVATGKSKTLGHMGQVTWCILIPVLVLVTVFALTNVKMKNLLPVTISDSVSYVKGAVPVISVMSPWLYFLYIPVTGNRQASLGSKIARFSMALGIALAVTITTVGVLGVELTEVLHDPFFSMIRTLNVFGILERMESLVIALWVLTDVIYLGGLLLVCVENTRKIVGARSVRWTAVLLGGVVVASSVLVADSASQLSYASEVFVPTVTLWISFALIPISAIVSKMRI